MRNLSCAVNVRRRGRSKSSGDAAAGADKEDGWRPTIVSPPAAARVLLSLIWGITTGCLSYAPKGKLPAGLCRIFLGTEGYLLLKHITINHQPAPCCRDEGSPAALFKCRGAE